MKKQDGFSVVEVLLVIIIAGIISGAGYFVWHSQKQAEKNYSEAESTSSSRVETKPSKDKIYDCNLDKQTLPKFAFNKGCFIISFPANWTIQQFDAAGNTYGFGNFTQNDTNFSFSSLGDVGKVTNKVNNFGGSLYIYDDSNAANSRLQHPEDGSIKQLKNGLSVWITNSKRTEVDGSTVETKCPIMYVVSGSVTEKRLANGRYLAFNGGFCWSKGLSSDLPYEQQINSQEFKDAYAMLESITFIKK
jgi:prepilin-type N-terminal cleavage/methylation domain-containing protein